jgi:hypothetical protein
LLNVGTWNRLQMYLTHCRFSLRNRVDDRTPIGEP